MDDGHHREYTRPDDRSRKGTGYLDQPILEMSSLTINRTKEVAVLTDPKTKQYLEEQNVRLYSYVTILEDLK